MPKTPTELERKVDQLDNDVHEIYSMLTTITDQQLAHDARFDSIDQRLDGHNSRLDSIDQRLDGHNTRLDSIDQRLDGHNTRLDTIDQKLDTVITILGGAPQG
ncbi:hypothetical protein EXU48_04475 [Occultella glacieicola]|uniref:t-SNARE coiled-coil homology domain-containing protein n=1 Tax=Occultella glacieicola TaxID=2518684 RepID=A0ABY2E7C0_9MICO|nr:hypothetical protein [Occultella glacieicola]TDE97453.1 hypothetical protein EXU48_04475 [Occultella glacieicola]